MVKKNRPRRRLRSNDILQELMEEVNQTKEDFQEILEADPENKDFHRIYGMYVGQILDLYKEILKHRSIDKNKLLIEALRGIVGYLMEIGEKPSAELVGLHLEAIGEKIKEQWKEIKAPMSLNRLTKKSATQFPQKSPHLTKTRKCKKSNANKRLS